MFRPFISTHPWWTRDVPSVTSRFGATKAAGQTSATSRCWAGRMPSTRRLTHPSKMKGPPSGTAPSIDSNPCTMDFQVRRLLGLWRRRTWKSIVRFGGDGLGSPSYGSVATDLEVHRTVRWRRTWKSIVRFGGDGLGSPSYGSVATDLEVHRTGEWRPVWQAGCAGHR